MTRKRTYITLLAAWAAGSASATLLSVTPLNDSGFENPVINNGTESNDTQEDVSGFSFGEQSYAQARIKNVAGESTWSAPTGNQVGGLMSWGGGNAWITQELNGTTDANATSHALTGVEVEGATVRLKLEVGIEQFGTFQSDDGLGIFGIQSGINSSDWLGSIRVYTGSESEATAEGFTADYYLDLDETAIGGDWATVSHDFTLASIESGSDEVQFFSYLSEEGWDSKEGIRVLMDDISVSVIPEPATFSLIAAFGGVILFVRRRLMR